MQVHVLRRNAKKCFTRYAHLQLIVLFLVLPGVSTTIFRTFLCDDGFVETKKLSFLEADLTLSCESMEYVHGQLREQKKLEYFENNGA